MTRSTFPNQIDKFNELYDLPPSLVSSAKRYQELKMLPTLNATEQAELNALSTTLGDYIITPETWNKFADALVNVETFFNQEVIEFIKSKQIEWSDFVKAFQSKGVFAIGTQYKFQNMVTYNGDLYLCLKDSLGKLPTNTEYWMKVSSKGEKGDVGLNAQFKGIYSDTKVYVVGDAVVFEGNIFYCIKDTTAGIKPSNGVNWMIYDKTIISATKPTTAQQGVIWIEVE